MASTDGRHEAEDARRWRLARALADRIDRGAGSTRRVVDAGRRAGIYSALMLVPPARVEGHLVTGNGTLMFTPLGQPIGNTTVSTTVIRLRLDQRLRLHLFDEFGLTLRRTWRVEVEDADGSRRSFALRRKDAAAVRDTLTAPAP